MSGRNFSLTNHLSDFVDREVVSGRHQNASEVVREALRRYEDELAAEKASLAVIERIAAEGISAIENGDFTLVDGKDASQALLERLNARAVARKTHASGPKYG
ncbi:type II toxin-antitoxin system ParD family antitoxin [Mesorhizobium sp. B2-4-17]|uniref:type II toxin-antitoxin system ParD family antitoxin n=1 Tax=Mesorhizobium sp. B2-4-17 TaxID=2589932 RepID=UPI0011298C27|nr:type II toxin-antitoxin system ParD family antitoxin [Mesorhizobium sp. B2-4-17]TPK85450.1 type II toxin-antitoxin system ParD family antitoxin [Mesorhizobium sp. B2-4-17]